MSYIVNYSNMPASGSQYPALSQAHPVFNGAVVEAAQNLGLPLALTSITALSAVAASVQAIAGLEMPNGGSLPVSLNALITVPSGGGKNRTVNLFKKPFEEFEASQQESYALEMTVYKTKLEVWNYQRKQLLRKSGNRTGGYGLVEALLEHDQQKPSAPRLHRIMFEDTTPEALLASMSGGGKNAWLVTSEGGIILSQHAMKNMPALNQIWSGDRVTIDRKTGESFSLVDARLSVLIMSQPGVFESFIGRYGALARESGFFARCLALSIPQNILGQFEDSRVLEWSHLAIFNEKVSRFLKMGLCGVYRSCLRFSPEAKSYWLSIKNAVNWELKHGGRFNGLPDLAARTPENIARIAALLHFFEERAGDISYETLEYSCRLCFWHVDQFIYMFSERSSGERDAELLYRWFSTKYQQYGVVEHLKNNVRQSAPSPLRKDGRFNAAFEVLVDRRYLATHIGGGRHVCVKFFPNGL